MIPAPTVPAADFAASSHAWVGVDLGQLAANLQSLRARLSGDAQLCAVLKADAYGLGIGNVAPVLMRGDVRMAAVASTEEAVAMRRAGYGGRLLRIRTATPQEAAAGIGHGIEELVGTPEVAARLAALAAGAGVPMRVHLAVNAGGMSRDGLELSAPDGPEQARAILAQPGLTIAGIMTHFPDDSRAAMQDCLATFRREADWLVAEGRLDRRDVQLHAANSMASLTLPESHLDMVRCGAAIYGCVGEAPDFAPAISLCATVASVMAFPAGNTVGYDRTIRLTRPSLLANIPLGYSNGYRRSFSNRGAVLLHGQRALVMGKVSMNGVMVDVTDISGVRPGDVAVFFGRQQGAVIGRDEVQQITGRVLADLCCTWGAVNARICRY